MADPFVAEIRIFGFDFAPRGWAFCDGQLLPLSQHIALFSLLGTTYGGDGQRNFALPNLQGAAPMFWGPGPGLSPRTRGEAGGSQTIALMASEMPAHSHAMRASQANGVTRNPPGQLLATGIGIGQYAAPGALTQLSPESIAPGGGDQPHNNMMPYLTLNFCIALEGVFPPRP